MTCRYCASKPVPPGCDTCCGSHCQEAAYWENVARNARNGSKKKTEAYAKSNAFSELCAARRTSYTIN